MRAGKLSKTWLSLGGGKEKTVEHTNMSMW